MTVAVRRYLIAFLGWMALYTVCVTALTPWLLEATQATGALRVFIALLPVVPALGAMREVFVFARSWDELILKKQLEALLFAYLSVGLGTFAYAFLEIHADAPPMATIWVFPALIAAVPVGQLLAHLRYR